MIHTGMSIHLHRGAEAKASETNGWVNLDSPDGAHTITIFLHNAEAGRSLIAALEIAVAQQAEREEAARARLTFTRV